MKKSILLFLIGFLLTTACFSQSIYDISFNDIDGNSISVNSFQGKTIIFFIAPISINDSVRLDDIKSFRNRYGNDSIRLVGIMSIEDGFSSANKTAIQSLYQSRGIDVLLTEGMYVKKSSGDNQSALMQWITKKSLNSRFEIEPKGIYEKFCISTQGKFCGIAPPENLLFDSIMSTLLKRAK